MRRRRARAMMRFAHISSEDLARLSRAIHPFLSVTGLRLGEPQPHQPRNRGRITDDDRRLPEAPSQITGILCG